MAQIVEVVGFGPVEFPDGMSREQMEVALKKLPKPSEQKQTLHTEETIYDTVSGLPLSSSPIQQNLGGNYATAQKVANTVAGMPVNYAMGAAKPVASIAQLVSKTLGSNAGDQPVRAINQIEQGINQNAGDTGQYFTKGATLAGEIANPVTWETGSNMIGLANKLPVLPSYAKNIIGGFGAGAANAVLTPEKTGLTPQQYEQEKLGRMGIEGGVGAAIPTAGAALQLGKNIATKSSGIATGAGSAPFEQAYMAGKTGNQEFLANMKNPTANAPQIIQDLKNNLSTMRQAKNAEYRSGMLDISKDKSVLGFGEIEKKLNELSKVGVFEGEVLNRKAQETLKNIRKEIAAWKAKDPAVFHTPEGMDALKQKLWEFAEDAPVGSRANLVAKDAYNAVKNTIAEQAPTYNQVMGKYSDATTQLREIEKALSLGEKSTAAASFSKLMSLMKDTPTANMRKELAQQLIQKGGKDVMPALAGQSLSTYAPTGLIGKGVDAFAAMDLAKALWHGGLTGVPAELATIAATSPKLMGQAYYGAGKTMGALEKLPSKIPLMSDMTPEQRQALARLLLVKGANTAIQGE
jgi:hypothetical protein